MLYYHIFSYICTKIAFSPKKKRYFYTIYGDFCGFQLPASGNQPLGSHSTVSESRSVSSAGVPSAISSVTPQSIRC